jgi:2-iminobutanoate/2-iminopropanoate deaminase
VIAKKALHPAGLADLPLPVSSVVESGDFVFLAGQVPYDVEGNLVSRDFEEQARKTFDNMKLCLEEAGCAMEDVVKVNAFITDLDDFETFNSVYGDYFQEPYPVRTTVIVKFVGDFKVEVEAVARKQSG